MVVIGETDTGKNLKRTVWGIEVPAKILRENGRWRVNHHILDFGDNNTDWERVGRLVYCISLRGDRREKESVTVVENMTSGKWKPSRVVLPGNLKRSKGFQTKVILPSFSASIKKPSIWRGHKMPLRERKSD